MVKFASRYSNSGATASTCMHAYELTFSLAWKFAGTRTLSQTPTNLDRFHVVYNTDGFDDEKHADRRPFHRLHLGDVVSVQGLQAFLGSDQHRPCFAWNKRSVDRTALTNKPARCCAIARGIRYGCRCFYRFYPCSCTRTQRSSKKRWKFLFLPFLEKTNHARTTIDVVASSVSTTRCQTTHSNRLPLRLWSPDSPPSSLPLSPLALSPALASSLPPSTTDDRIARSYISLTNRSSNFSRKIRDSDTNGVDRDLFDHSSRRSRRFFQLWFHLRQQLLHIFYFRFCARQFLQTCAKWLASYHLQRDISAWKETITNVDVAWLAWRYIYRSHFSR